MKPVLFWCQWCLELSSRYEQDPPAPVRSLDELMRHINNEHPGLAAWMERIAEALEKEEKEEV